MVEFIYFVRNEEKFTSVNELKEQIKFDKEKVLKYINNL